MGIRSDDRRSFCNGRDRGSQTYGDDGLRGAYDDDHARAYDGGPRDAYGLRDVCDHAYVHVPRDDDVSHGDHDARDDHDDAYARGRAYALLYGGDHAYGPRDDDAYDLDDESDDDPHDDHDDVPPCDHAYVRGRACDDGLRDGHACDARGGHGDAPHGGHAYVCVRASHDDLRDDDAYDPRDVRAYDHVRACDGDPHDDRDDVLRDGRAYVRVHDDAYVLPCAHAYDPLYVHVHGDGDVSQFPYDCDDDDAR